MYVLDALKIHIVNYVFHTVTDLIKMFFQHANISLMPDGSLEIGQYFILQYLLNSAGTCVLPGKYHPIHACEIKDLCLCLQSNFLLPRLSPYINKIFMDHQC
jgi:hypothetical protein